MLNGVRLKGADSKVGCAGSNNNGAVLRVSVTNIKERKMENC